MGVCLIEQLIFENSFLAESAKYNARQIFRLYGIKVISNNFEASYKMCNTFTLPRVVDANIEGDG